MNTDIQYIVDRFADIQVLRYTVEGFEKLPLKQKLFVYYLSEAALSGRDILFDQNYRYNLPLRRLLTQIWEQYDGPRDTPDFEAFTVYLKRFWFANGIHHHYSTVKMQPEFDTTYWNALLDNIGYTGDRTLWEKVLFDPEFDSKRVQLDGKDLITASANNFYSSVTQAEVEDFYAQMSDPSDQEPISYGLNTHLTKDQSGQLIEQVWSEQGWYSNSIKAINENLRKALSFAETEQQKQVIERLIDYYRTGDLKLFDEYSILWVRDTLSQVDFVNGFIETYGDPLGLKGSWESMVNFRNEAATKRTKAISDEAAWFEAHSPIDDRFRKKEVKGVSAKVITAAMLAGDCYPATPIGINLPNANWIRKEYGSKSVTIENIMEAYEIAAQGNGFNEEFYENEADRKLYEKYGFVTDVLHTDLHECLGHGSGQLLPGVSPDALKAYGATLEEARADLFALYFMADPKMLELGVLGDKDAYKAAYYHQMLVGLLTQSVRIPFGENYEEAHMRNRALIARWVYEKGEKTGACRLIRKSGKTYLQISDYEQLRKLFGKLLGEIQRIKSEGDYEAGKALVETYGVTLDPTLHREVLDRYAKLDIAPYKGFVNPVYTLEYDAQGHISDVKVDYTEGYVGQMIRYDKQYAKE
ncbi:MAG: dihydrofolate reductase [Paludibacteraceae bacterium]|nr:dihydrofolate reductase [Paludibacteraceae bacterium]